MPSIRNIKHTIMQIHIRKMHEIIANGIDSIPVIIDIKNNWCVVNLSLFLHSITEKATKKINSNPEINAPTSNLISTPHIYI